MKNKLGEKIMEKPITFTALAFPNSSISSVVGPAEILMLAAEIAKVASPKINIVTMDNNEVVGFGNTILKPTIEIEQVQDTDILLIGSIGFPEQNLASINQETLDWINNWHSKKTPIISICSGAFVLAKAGLLLDTKATTHWKFVNLFTQLFPDVNLCAESRVIFDKNIYTTSGVYEYNDVMMLIVEELFGQKTRQECIDFIFGESERGKQLILSNFLPHRQHDDTLIHQLQDWLHAQNCISISVAELANKAFLSERQMKRRFKAATGKSPLSYIQEVKLCKAKIFLEISNKNVSEICNEIGYEDVRYFRELFKKTYGATPSAYRKRYQFN